MKPIIVAGAVPVDDPEGVYRRLLLGAGAVVAADAAGEWCIGLGRVPDVVVGDFDSARPGALERLRAAGADVVRHPADKDRSDLDLAVLVARERFGVPVTLTAAFSGRFDHTLAAFGTLLRAGAGASAVEPGWSGFAVHAGSPVTIPTRIGQPFGVISPAGALGVTIEGGRWGLAGEDLGSLESSAASNRAAGASVSVACAEGSAILLLTTD